MKHLHYSTISALLTGLAFAGAMVEAIALISYERIRFGLIFRRGRLGWLALPLLVMAGPIILLKSLWEAELPARGKIAFVLIGLAIILGWSTASGHLLLRMIALIMGQ